MNNAIYGKTTENVRNRIDLKVVNNKKDYLKCTSKPSYLSHKIFGNNLVAMRKSKLAYLCLHTCNVSLTNLHMLEYAF